MKRNGLNKFGLNLWRQQVGNKNKFKKKWKNFRSSMEGTENSKKNPVRRKEEEEVRIGRRSGGKRRHGISRWGNNPWRRTGIGEGMGTCLVHPCNRQCMQNPVGRGTKPHVVWQNVKYLKMHTAHCTTVHNKYTHVCVDTITTEQAG